MRKKVFPILLTAMMVVSATGYNGRVKVSADEPQILSEETEEAADDEWWMKDVDEASPAEPTASPSDSANLDSDGEDSAPVDSEDDVAPAEWYKNYEFELAGNYIILNRYIGTNPKVYVHKSAMINGDEYLTTFSMDEETDYWYISPWGDGQSKTDVKSITFQDGFVMPTSCRGLFAYCSNLESVDLSGVDTSKVKDMSWMFMNSEELTSIDISGFNTENVKTMLAMFAGTAIEELDLRHFNTKNVVNMERMFSDCYRLKSLDVSSFDTSKVTVAGSMFDSCYQLTSLDLSSFDFSKLTGVGQYGSLEGMFYNCSRLDKLYTPKNVKYEMQLARTMYDPKGIAYFELPNNTAHTKLLTHNFTGWQKNGDEYYYRRGGVPCTNETPILGKGYINGKLGWYVATLGKYDKSFVGIAEMQGVGYRFARNGKYDKSFSGVAQATNGIWYYVNKGAIDRSFSGKLALATNGRWYYISKGKPTKYFTGKIAETTDGRWYYCTDGRPDMNFSGKIAYCTNGNWYYVTKGKIDRSFTGIATATNGKKYYVINGLLDKTFSGKVSYKGKTYNIVNGAVK